MTEETRAKILKYISDEHMHHDDAIDMKFPIKIQRNGIWEELEPVYVNTPSTCMDGDSPYINSLELEEFIKGL